MSETHQYDGVGETVQSHREGYSLRMLANMATALVLSGAVSGVLRINRAIKPIKTTSKSDANAWRELDLPKSQPEI